MVEVLKGRLGDGASVRVSYIACLASDAAALITTNVITLR